MLPTVGYLLAKQMVRVRFPLVAPGRMQIRTTGKVPNQDHRRLGRLLVGPDVATPSSDGDGLQNR